MKNSITLLLTAILVTASHENEDSSGAQSGAKAATQFDSSLEEPLKNLAIAIRDGDYDTFTNLVGTAIPLDLELPDKKTLLTVTASNGNVETTQFLISRGLEVNTEDYRGMTPLHYAALYGRNDVIPVLLNKQTPEQFAAHARLRSAPPPCVEHELNNNEKQLVGLTL